MRRFLITGRSQRGKLSGSTRAEGPMGHINRKNLRFETD